MIPRKLRIGVARFPYAGNGGTSAEHPDIADWLVRTVPKINKDERCIDGVWPFVVADTPITMTRNLALKQARENGVDVLMMVDSDQNPDLYLKADPTAKPFWESSFDFLYEHWDKGPCCIAAPYCGPLPHPVRGGESNVYVFRWARSQNDDTGEGFRLRQFSREEAAQRAGIEEVAALPTGMIMLDLRLLDVVPPPWFEYEWEDPPYNSVKASTEDVYFTRNCSLLGVPQYCNWDAWVGHAKPSIVGRPMIIGVNEIGPTLKKAWESGQRSDERTIELGAGKSPQEICAELGLRQAQAFNELPAGTIVSQGQAEGDTIVIHDDQMENVRYAFQKAADMAIVNGKRVPMTVEAGGSANTVTAIDPEASP